jgi:hypothetical protein
MARVVLHDEENGGERGEPSPRVQLHALIDALTDEAVPPVLALLALWLEGPHTLAPMWGLAVVACVTF